MRAHGPSSESFRAINRCVAPTVETLWHPGRVRAIWSCRLREPNRIEGGTAWGSGHGAAAVEMNTRLSNRDQRMRVSGCGPAPRDGAHHRGRLRACENIASLLRTPLCGCGGVAPREHFGHLARQTPLFSRRAPCLARQSTPSRRPSLFSQALVL